MRPVVMRTDLKMITFGKYMSNNPQTCFSGSEDIFGGFFEKPLSSLPKKFPNFPLKKAASSGPTPPHVTSLTFPELSDTVETQPRRLPDYQSQTLELFSQFCFNSTTQFSLPNLLKPGGPSGSEVGSSKCNHFIQEMTTGETEKER